MKLSWLALGLAIPMLAQTPEPGLKEPSDWTIGFGLHMGFPSGELSKAVNNHTGYGVAVQFPISLGGGLIFRPQIEGTGYRVTRYDTLAWLFNYDDREVLRTYRLGVDLLVPLMGGPNKMGPYLVGGIAFQNSSYDRLTQDSNGDSITTSTRLSLWGPAWTAGVGMKISPRVAVELRYYRFDYQDPGALENSATTKRSGESFLMGIVVRY